MSDSRTLSRLDEILCTALGVGLVLVAVLPAARGMSVVGWLPLWLVGMPAVAWWATRGFPLPVDRNAVPAARIRASGVRSGPQARRSVRAVRRAAQRRAA